MLALLAGRFRFRLADCMGGEEGVRALQISNFTLSVEGGLYMHVFSRASTLQPKAVRAASATAASCGKPPVPKGAVECTFTVTNREKASKK